MDTPVFWKEVLPKSENKIDVLDNYSTSGDCPLLGRTINFVQNKYHTTDLWTHLRSCYINSWGYTDDPILAMGAMMHDIGKVLTRRFSSEKKDWTFHGHETMGARAIREWMIGKKFDLSDTARVFLIIDQHQFRFYPDTQEATIRRWLCKIGQQGINDLFITRLIDRQSNPNNKNKPLETREFIELRQQVFELMSSGKVIFTSQLKISREVITKYIGEEEGKLFDCVNFIYHNANKNNPEDIEVYLKSAKPTIKTTTKIGGP